MSKQLSAGIPYRRATLVSLGVLVCLIVLTALYAKYPPARLIVTVRGPETSPYQVFYDAADGYTEEKSVIVDYRKSDHFVRLSFSLPPERIERLRIDPGTTPGVIEITGIVLETYAGTCLAWNAQTIVRDFHPLNDIAEFTDKNGILRITSVGGDPYFEIDTVGPVLAAGRVKRARLYLLSVFLSALVFIGQVAYTVVRRRLSRSPTKRYVFGALVLTSVLATILSCYPVVFFGKSFVSPGNGGVPLLYATSPFVPSGTDIGFEDVKGSDVGALLWQHIPISIVQGRAVLKDHAVPLWNRYNSLGVSLIGQGQSMLLDPLNMLTWPFPGWAYAWDAKFLLSKLLFSLGIGLAVFIATTHIPTAVLLTLSSSFIGFFSYRFNHPAFFTLCYSPWVLVCWFSIVRSTDLRRAAAWMGGLFVSNWMLINSGTVKEAFVLFAILNLCGLMALLFPRRDKKHTAAVLIGLAAAAAAFILISAPVWLTFLDTLHKSVTCYDTPGITRIPPAMAAGFFDEIFYRHMSPQHLVYAPSVNFFVLLFFLWALAGMGKLLKNPLFTATLLSWLGCALVAFDVLPSAWLLEVPFLRNIHHVNSTFSCPLVVLTFIVAGFGGRRLFEALQSGDNRWKKDLSAVLLMFLAVLAPALLLSRIYLTSFYTPYVYTVSAALIMFPLLIRAFFRQGRATKNVIIVCCVILFCLIHWRHGMHLKIGADEYTMNPQKRVNLAAPSPTIAAITGNEAEPFRILGLNGNLFAGYNAAIAIESLNSPEALANPYYRQLLSTVKGLEWCWLFFPTREDFPSREPFYRMCNIKYFIDQPSNDPIEEPSLTRTRYDDLDVYEDADVWPRAFFTDRVQTHGSPDELVASLGDRGRTPFVSVEESDLLTNRSLMDLAVGHGDGVVVPAREYVLTTNATTFTIDAPCRGVVFLSEAYVVDDFRATVNGAPVDYFRCNHLFKGVVIPQPGTYTVSFSYRPGVMTVSLICAALGTVILLVGGVLVAVMRLTRDERRVTVSR